MWEEFASQESVTNGQMNILTDGGNDNIPELSFKSPGITWSIILRVGKGVSCSNMDHSVHIYTGCWSVFLRRNLDQVPFSTLHRQIQSKKY